MKNHLVIALGLLLLVSAAAATGNGNDVDVKINAEICETSITNANVAQLTVDTANLLGNNISAVQDLDLSITENCVTGLTTTSECPDDVSNGLNDGRTNLIQYGALLLNDTGCDNIDTQTVDLEIAENYLTIGNITQRAVQAADVLGNNNAVNQLTDADAGFADEECEGSPNFLTNSDLKQLSSLAVSVTGSDNKANQKVDQDAFDNCLTNSKIFEQAALSASVKGCGKTLSQEADQLAIGNDLTDSWINEIITMTKSSSHQFALEESLNNCLTNSAELQSISLAVSGASCDVSLISEDNSATNGKIIQESIVNTS